MTELLAPAGDPITLKAAIASGADAVYLGLSAFNARIKAGNFSEDNIDETVRYCHLFGVKVYVTVNISVKNDELTAIERLIEACKAAKVDAFIVTDLAVVAAIKKIAPEIPMHASTQMGVCNLAAARYAERLGFLRVILSRETTLDEIRAIKANTKLEIEYFVHGALCVAFSGKCLMSSIMIGGSGNRGRCLQPCRLHYTEKTTGNDGYLLSASDLCLIDKLSELKKAGVDSFKIEGRLRRPEYVYNTVKTYRKVIDNDYKWDNEDFEILKAAYNRGGFTRGYSYDDTADIMSVKVQGNLGKPIGKIKFIKNGFVQLDKTYAFSKGEGYKLFDEKGNEIGGGRVEKLQNGMPEIKGARVGYSVNITSSEFAFKERKITVDVDYILDADGVLSVTFRAGKTNITICDAPYEKAENKPLDEAALDDALTKFGDGSYCLGEVKGRISGNFFAPRSTLNLLRRRGIERLTEEILGNYERKLNDAEFAESIIKNGANYNSLIAVEVQNAAQLSESLLNDADVIVYYPDEFSMSTAKDLLDKTGGKEAFIKLTPNAREKDVALFEKFLPLGFTGVYCDNLYAVELAQKFKLKVFCGQGLNVFNNKTLEIINPDYYLASPELNAKELRVFSSPFVFSYGKLPLMNLSHCPYKLNNGNRCNSCNYNKNLAYIDDKNYVFDIYRNKAVNCYFTLYNSKITDISSKYANCGFNYYLNMLQCNCKSAAEIAHAFRTGAPLDTQNATNGHMKRGVE